MYKQYIMNVIHVFLAYYVWYCDQIVSPQLQKYVKTEHLSPYELPFFVGDQAIFRLELNNREGNDLKHKGKYRESLFVVYLTRLVLHILLAILSFQWTEEFLPHNKLPITG